MPKKLIRLTESDLHRIVKESVQRILRENRVNEILNFYPSKDHTDNIEDYDKIDKYERDRLHDEGEFAQDQLHPQRDSRFAAGEHAKHGITKRGSDMFMNRYFPKH